MHCRCKLLKSRHAFSNSSLLKPLSALKAARALTKNLKGDKSVFLEKTMSAKKALSPDMMQESSKIRYI